MSKFTTPRGTRFAVGLAVLSVFAAAPMAAQAETDTSAVIVGGGGAVTLTTPPVFGDFPGVTLDGINQTVTTSVDPYVVTDPTGTRPGWTVNIKASLPANGGSTITMVGAALALTAPTAGTEGTNASAPPLLAGGTNIIGDTGVNVARAAATTGGAGVWTLTQGTDHLKLTIPADAKAASYSTTITTTLGAAV